MANRYWISGGTGNWNSTTNWSATSGGVSGATVPVGTTAGDDVFFNSASGVGTANLNVTGVVKSLNLTNFGGTLALGVNGINISGNVTIGAGMSSSQITGTGSLFILANSTFDILSGFTIPNIGMGITTSGVRVVITLVRDTQITNFTLTQNNPNTANNFGINRTSAGNGDNLYIAGNFTHSANVTSMTGTTTLNFVTSETSTLTNAAQTSINVIINATGSLTGSLYKAGGTLVRTSGTVSTLNITIYSCAITSNGAIFQNITSPAIVGSTITTNDDLICGNGTFSQANSFGVTWVHNSGSVVRMRGTTANINSANLSVIFDGTQNCSVDGRNQVSGLNMTFNPYIGSQISIASFASLGGTNTITYLTSNGGPTPVVTGSLTVVGATTTFNTSPSSSNFIKWGGLIISNANVINATTDIHFTGLTSLANSLTVNTSTGSKFFMAGTNAFTNPYSISGTAPLVFYYSGTCQQAGGSIASNLQISPASGQTYIISSLIKSNNGSTITYIPSGGTINASGTLTISNSISMLTSGMSWTNITTANSVTLTLNEPLTVTNNLTIGGNNTFSGTSGWNCANLLCSTNGSIITLQTGNTYNTTTNVNMLGIDTSRISMVSSSTSGRAIWTLSPLATQSMVYVNGTRIDSSLGQTIWSFGPPVLTDTINWNSGSKPRPVAWTFVN